MLRLRRGHRAQRLPNRDGPTLRRSGLTGGAKPCSAATGTDTRRHLALGPPQRGACGDARLVRGEEAELQRRGDASPAAHVRCAPLHAPISAGEDEPLLVGREPVDRRAEEARDREAALRVEHLAAGCRLRDDTRDQRDTGAPELLGDGLARLWAEERQRGLLGVTTVISTSSWPISLASPAVRIASSQAGSGHTAPGGTTIAIRFE
jgi:hypothetical protein